MTRCFAISAATYPAGADDIVLGGVTDAIPEPISFRILLGGHALRVPVWLTRRYSPNNDTSKWSIDLHAALQRTVTLARAIPRDAETRDDSNCLIERLFA